MQSLAPSTFCTNFEMFEGTFCKLLWKQVGGHTLKVQVVKKVASCQIVLLDIEELIS